MKQNKTIKPLKRPFFMPILYTDTQKKPKFTTTETNALNSIDHTIWLLAQLTTSTDPAQTQLKKAALKRRLKNIIQKHLK
jgi:hypothetical protein